MTASADKVNWYCAQKKGESDTSSLSPFAVSVTIYPIATLPFSLVRIRTQSFSSSTKIFPSPISPV